MENQHRQISGYRELSQSEIDLMNEGKELEKKCLEFLNKVDAHPDTDKRCSALARTNIQQGFMWGIRAVARPQ